MLWLGLDLGQRRDHSAIAVVDPVDRMNAYHGLEFQNVTVRHLERMPLGLPYPEVVERVREVLERVQRTRGRCGVVADATGVGAPVIDLLKDAKLGCDLVPVTITGGDHETVSGGFHCVPKKDLVAAIQVLLQRGELRIAGSLRETPRLVKELMDMRMWEGRRPGRMRMGAEGAGEHDDLAMAVALACWKARPRRHSTTAPMDPVLQHHCRF